MFMFYAVFNENDVSKNSISDYFFILFCASNSKRDNLNRVFQRKPMICSEPKVQQHTGVIDFVS